ncbi:Ribose-phosphate pyrophosphokinase 2 [compost metagenome]
MIKYKVGNITTHVEQWKFPDGCVGTNINVGAQPVDPNVPNVTVTAIFGDSKFTINDNIMALAFVRSALRTQYPLANLHLVLPYVPYGRQDRACNVGEAAQLKVIGNMINGMDFATVHVVDPHSTVTAAVIDRLYAQDQYSVFNGVRQSFRETYIVAPDQGASKKCEDFAKRVDAAGVITCVKVRDLKTSKILSLKVIDDVPPDADLLVLDDLCDAGGTFIGLAQELRKHNPCRLDLAVTHGLFTKGVGVVKDHFDKIFTTNSYESDKNGAIVIDLF